MMKVGRGRFALYTTGPPVLHVPSTYYSRSRATFACIKTSKFAFRGSQHLHSTLRHQQATHTHFLPGHQPSYLTSPAPIFSCTNARHAP